MVVRLDFERMFGMAITMLLNVNFLTCITLITTKNITVAEVIGENFEKVTFRRTLHGVNQETRDQALSKNSGF